MSKIPCPITRREFSLSLCGAAMARFALNAADFTSMPWNGPATVAKVYLGAPQVHWPKPTLDLAMEVAEIEARLAEVERRELSQRPFCGR